MANFWKHYNVKQTILGTEVFKVSKQIVGKQGKFGMNMFYRVINNEG